MIFFGQLATQEKAGKRIFLALKLTPVVIFWLSKKMDCPDQMDMLKSSMKSCEIINLFKMICMLFQFVQMIVFGSQIIKDF